MSWQDYVTNNLVGSGKLTKAAIIGQQGGVWATSPGLDVSTEQQNAIIAALTKDDYSTLQTNGIRVGDTKFMFLRPNDKSVYGKLGAGGVCCSASKQAILIGIYDEPTTQVDANKVVEDLAAYLVGVGF